MNHPKDEFNTARGHSYSIIGKTTWLSQLVKGIIGLSTN